MARIIISVVQIQKGPQRSGFCLYASMNFLFSGSKLLMRRNFMSSVVTSKYFAKNSMVKHGQHLWSHVFSPCGCGTPGWIQSYYWAEAGLESWVDARVSSASLVCLSDCFLVEESDGSMSMSLVFLLPLRSCIWMLMFPISTLSN